VRLFVSKSLAGGLSAGIVLAWAPVLLASDTVLAWLARGVVWTLLFELLLLGFKPFEHALWETGRGEQLSRRMERLQSRLHSGPQRRRVGRLAGLAILPVATAVLLVASGLGVERPDAEADSERVVRVTNVTKPVTVKRVVAQVAPAASVGELEPSLAPVPPPSPDGRPDPDRAEGRPRSGGLPPAPKTRETPTEQPAPAPVAVPEPVCGPGGCPGQPPPGDGSQS